MQEETIALYLIEVVPWKVLEFLKQDKLFLYFWKVYHKIVILMLLALVIAIKKYSNQANKPQNKSLNQQ